MSFVFPVIGATEWSGGSWMPGSQTHRGRTHAAIDIYANRGQAIVSPVAGHVKAVGSSNIGGNWIQIEGRDGNVYYFAHMANPTTFVAGQQVGGGNVIGAVGNTGSAKTTSPHVHFSVKRNGVAVNPIKMLQDAVLIPEVGLTGAPRHGHVAGFEQDPNADDPFSVQNQQEYWDNLPTDVDAAEYQQAKDEVPGWYTQLEEYRRQLAQGIPPEGGRKVKAREILHGTLRGMASMVRESGFDTGVTPDTGIDEDVTILEREGAR